MKTFCVASVAAVLAVVLASPAVAAHGKAGLWEMTMTSSEAANMPDMSRLPPQAQAQMRARGLSTGSNTFKSKYCMTAAQVAADKPLFRESKTCKTQNVKITANSFSADTVCTGGMNARGHIQITWWSPEHYSGVQTSDVVIAGHARHTSMNIDARWLAPNCGNIE